MPAAESLAPSPAIRSPVDVPARKARYLLAALLLAGAAVRLALWPAFADVPPHDDEVDYHLLAQSLLERGEYALKPGRPTSLRPPLYPLFIAGVYGLFGVDNWQAVRLCQAGLSLLMVVLLYRLGTVLYSRRVGLWLGGLFCFYPSFLGYNNLLYAEVLFTFLLCATCYVVVQAFQRDSLRVLVAVGVMLGLTALTRSVVWVFPPVLAVYLLATWKGNWKQRMAAAGSVVLAFVLTIAPWSIRNSRLQDTFIAIDVMGGRNFMMGNYEHTPLYRSWAAISLQGDQYWYDVLKAKHPEVAGMTQGQRDKLAMRTGLEFISENPGLTLQRDLVKFCQFWGLERELAAQAAKGYYGEMPRWLVILVMLVTIGSYVSLMIAGVFGMILAAPADKRIHWFLILMIAFMSGIHALVFAHSRYRLPVMPLVLLYAAGALTQARDLWNRRGRWSFWLAGGLTGVLIAVWLWEIIVVEQERFFRVMGNAAS